ncbi:sigma-70 family RNA polymerase sigma factor [Kaistia algarum]|uniref:sigma-70 family RNA polymerase sigma factor n=1 Tax=Kaistia algarum TaxID=2083279 RepID=UPI002B1E6026|nr:sigma-70 family RNA polymerase sigma factor [Kaistia algarum]
MSVDEESECEVPAQGDLWRDWMKAANRGDETAYRRLLSALAPVIRAMVRRTQGGMSAGAADVEDVVQECLLAIHLKRQTWDEALPLLPWVAAIARNKTIDNLRRRGRRLELPIDGLEEILPAAEAEESLSAPEIDRALAELSKTQREVVRAVSVDGASIRETGSRLSMTEGAVRVALHRGLTALAAKMRELKP